MTPTRSALFSLLLCVAACDQDETSSSFRSVSLDVNVQLTQAGEGGSDDGTVVWEIVEAAASTAGEGGSDDGTIVWEIVEFDAPDPGNGAQTSHIEWIVNEQHPQAGEGGSDDGTIVWEIVEVASSKTRCRVQGSKLYDAGSKMLLAVDGGVVSNGSGPVLSFDDTSVLDSKGNPVLEADADLSAATRGRQLTIAALVTGVCG